MFSHAINSGRHVAGHACMQEVLAWLLVIPQCSVLHITVLRRLAVNVPNDTGSPEISLDVTQLLLQQGLAVDIYSVPMEPSLLFKMS
jgi:hypothetical protein